MVARGVENPYWQYFCGFDDPPLELPIDPSSPVRWRRRSGQDGVALPLHETIAPAPRSEAVQPQSLERVSVDTTVQPKAIAHPLAARLHQRGRAVRRQLEGRPEVAAPCAQALTRVERLPAQQRTDQGELYALHAPELACIAKGKAHKKSGFGAKVSVAITHREGLVVGMQSHPGNRYDGQTLPPALAQLERRTGTTPARGYVDRGYRGHRVSGATAVVIAGRRRGITATLKRELRRRCAIEAMIGHMKLDGKRARNQLQGAPGDPSMRCAAAPATTCA